MLDTSVSERHTLSILVDNEPGVLARTPGSLSTNIDNVCRSETEVSSIADVVILIERN